MSYLSSLIFYLEPKVLRFLSKYNHSSKLNKYSRVLELLSALFDLLGHEKQLYLLSTFSNLALLSLRILFDRVSEDLSPKLIKCMHEVKRANISFLNSNPDRFNPDYGSCE